MSDSDWNKSAHESSESSGEEDNPSENYSIKGEIVYGNFVEEDGQLRLKPGTVDEWLTKVQWAKWQYEEATRRNWLRREEQIASGTFDPTKKPPQKPKPVDECGMTPQQYHKFVKSEEKKAQLERLQWVRRELLLLKATKTLLEGLQPGKENHEACISILDKLYPIPFPSDMLMKNPAIVEVLNVVKQYKNKEVRTAARKVFDRMRCVFAVPWGKPFMEEFFDRAEEYKKKAKEQKDKLMRKLHEEEECIPDKYIREETELDVLWSLKIYKRRPDYSQFGGPFGDEGEEFCGDYVVQDSDLSSGDEDTGEEEDDNQSDYLPSSPDEEGDESDGGEGGNRNSHTGEPSAGDNSSSGNQGQSGNQNGSHDDNGLGDRGSRTNQAQGPEESEEHPSIDGEMKNEISQLENNRKLKKKSLEIDTKEIGQERKKTKLTEWVVGHSKRAYHEAISENEEQPEKHENKRRRKEGDSCDEATDRPFSKQPTLPLHRGNQELNTENRERRVKPVFERSQYTGLRTVKCIPRHIPRVRSMSSLSNQSVHSTKPSVIVPPQFENPVSEQEVIRCLTALTTMCALQFDRESLEDNPQLVENVLKASHSTNSQVKRLGAAIYVKFWSILQEDEAMNKRMGEDRHKSVESSRQSVRGRSVVKRERQSQRTEKSTIREVNEGEESSYKGGLTSQREVMTIDGIDIAVLAECEGEDSDWWDLTQDVGITSEEQVDCINDVRSRDSSTGSCHVGDSLPQSQPREQVTPCDRDPLVDDSVQLSNKDQEEDVKDDTGDILEVVPKLPFQIGDIVWAKLGRFPWWPAMVCLDPRSLLCYKSGRGGPLVHVQYFEEKPTRSWVKEKMVEPFQGLDAPQLQKGGMFFSKNKPIKKAARLADVAWKLPLEERLRVVLFNYQTPDVLFNYQTQDIAGVLDSFPDNKEVTSTLLDPEMFTESSVQASGTLSITEPDSSIEIRKIVSSSARVLDLEITDIVVRDSSRGVNRNVGDEINAETLGVLQEMVSGEKDGSERRLGTADPKSLGRLSLRSSKRLSNASEKSMGEGSIKEDLKPVMTCVSSNTSKNNTKFKKKSRSTVGRGRDDNKESNDIFENVKNKREMLIEITKVTYQGSERDLDRDRQPIKRNRRSNKLAGNSSERTKGGNKLGSSGVRKGEPSLEEDTNQGRVRPSNNTAEKHQNLSKKSGCTFGKFHRGNKDKGSNDFESSENTREMLLEEAKVTHRVPEGSVRNRRSARLTLKPSEGTKGGKVLGGVINKKSGSSGRYMGEGMAYQSSNTAENSPKVDKKSRTTWDKLRRMNYDTGSIDFEDLENSVTQKVSPQRERQPVVKNRRSNRLAGNSSKRKKGGRRLREIRKSLSTSEGNGEHSLEDDVKQEMTCRNRNTGESSTSFEKKSRSILANVGRSYDKERNDEDNKRDMSIKQVDVTNRAAESSSKRNCQPFVRNRRSTRLAGNSSESRKGGKVLKEISKKPGSSGGCEGEPSLVEDVKQGMAYGNSSNTAENNSKFGNAMGKLDRRNCDKDSNDLENRREIFNQAKVIHRRSKSSPKRNRQPVVGNRKSTRFTENSSERSKGNKVSTKIGKNFGTSRGVQDEPSFGEDVTQGKAYESSYTEGSTIIGKKSRSTLGKFQRGNCDDGCNNYEDLEPRRDILIEETNTTHRDSDNSMKRVRQLGRRNRNLSGNRKGGRILGEISRFDGLSGNRSRKLGKKSMEKQGMVGKQACVEDRLSSESVSSGYVRYSLRLRSRKKENIDSKRGILETAGCWLDESRESPKEGNNKNIEGSKGMIVQKKVLKAGRLPKKQSSEDRNCSNSGKAKLKVYRKKAVLKSKTKEMFVTRCYQKKKKILSERTIRQEKKLCGEAKDLAMSRDNARVTRKSPRNKGACQSFSVGPVKTEPLSIEDDSNDNQTTLMTPKSQAAETKQMNGDIPSKKRGYFVTMEHKSGRKGSRKSQKKEQRKPVEVSQQKERRNKRKTSVSGCPYQLGDLLWARLLAQWWPAIVCLDPVQLSYYKCRGEAKVHLQYFQQGQPTQSWVTISSVELYLGSENKDAKTGGKLYKRDPDQMWAIHEADKAFALCLQERIQPSIKLSQRKGRRPFETECGDTKLESNVVSVDKTVKGRTFNFQKTVTL